MNIGDKVRFLNDIGGGKIVGFDKGGLVIVEDEDGFEMPVRQDNVVVVEETNKYNFVKKQAPKQEQQTVVVDKEGNEEMLQGKDYLRSKTVAKPENEVDEQTEALIARMEMTLSKLEAKVAQCETKIAELEGRLEKAEADSASAASRFEAQLNLMKNEWAMKQKEKKEAREKKVEEKKVTVGDIIL